MSSPGPTHRTICLWSGPRNVSTALMYSFRQRSDTTVVDEPLYGHYLRVSRAAHPGAAQVLASMDTDGKRVMQTLLQEPSPRPVLFLKQMAHHLQDLDDSFLDRTVNVLLVRDPAQMIPSLCNQIPQPSLRDTGLQVQWHLLQRLRAGGQSVPVIDARELLLDPAAVLRSLCDDLGLPFENAMLSWPPGPKPEDGVWAPHWYHNVHRSTGFQPYRHKDEAVRPDLQPLLQLCSKYYQLLTNRNLAPGEHPQ